MEFKSLKNIESNFRLIRICCALFAGLCAAVAVASVGFSYAFAERQRQKIYVLDGGRSLMVALSQDLSQNRPVEAREHVRRFHELFFTLSPDKAAIESNLNRALLMADRSALSYYKALSEKGFFNRLIAGGISQTVRIDSIRCNFDSYPYQVTTYARQRIMRESTITERSLVTTCRLINAVRSDNNPQGFLQLMTVDRLCVRTRYARRWLRRRHDRLAPRQRQRIALAALLLFAAADMWMLLRGVLS